MSQCILPLHQLQIRRDMLSVMCAKRSRTKYTIFKIQSNLKQIYAEFMHQSKSKFYICLIIFLQILFKSAGFAKVAYIQNKSIEIFIKTYINCGENLLKIIWFRAMINTKRLLRKFNCLQTSLTQPLKPNSGKVLLEAKTQNLKSFLQHFNCLHVCRK